MKHKFIYQSYDYSFLKPKCSYNWEVYFPQAVRVAAQTIGFDMAPVEPMNEPVGRLFYFEPTVDAATTAAGVSTNDDYTATTATYSHTTYDTFADNVMAVSNYIASSSARGYSNYIVTNSSISSVMKGARKRKDDSKTKFFARRNFFKTLRNKRHG